jgi:hypothetical protein
MNDKKMVERRKHQRFRVREGVFAVLGPHSNKIGTIIDISMTGLAFNYIEDTVDQQDKSFELNIFLAEDSFHLNNIRFQEITDQRAKKVPFSSINLRRRGVRFDTLTPAQTSQLGHFIRNHTVGTA